MSNSVPTFTGLSAQIFFNENDVNATPQVIDADVAFTDLDANLVGSTLTVSGLLAEDTVSIRNQGTGAGQIGFSGGVITYEGNTIGVATGGAGGTLTVTFLFGATAAAVDALVQNLTYANSSNAPTAFRTFELKITDAAGIAAIAPPTFVEQTGPVDNPFDAIDVGQGSAPAFADLDGDGDLDIVVGNNNGVLRYFENTPAGFVEQTGTDNPFNGFDVGAFGKPTLGDLDGDGDLDAVVGSDSGTLFYFQNNGTAITPLFASPTAGAFGLTDVGAFTAPSLADLDGDGDLDAVVGEEQGALFYFKNTGTATAPAFVQQTGGDNPFNGFDVFLDSTPSFADVDGDGDLDAIVGNIGGVAKYFENTGTATAPAFVERTGLANPFNGVSVGNFSAPSFADLDRDGDPDLVVGELDGNLNYFENTTPPAIAPDFVQVSGTANPFNGVDIDHASPAFADLDGDGDLDALVGQSDGNLSFLQNTGTATAPVFASPTVNPFGLHDIVAFSSPSFADLDGDGDLDIVAGNTFGNFRYFQNTGTATAPAFATATSNPFGLNQVDFNAKPTFADLDGDGDLDALVGDSFGTLDYFRNDGSATAPLFQIQNGPFNPATGDGNPFNGVNIGSNAAPAFGDVDGDGDLDTVVGELDGILNYFENTGTAEQPTFVARTGAANPFNGVNVGSQSTPSFADLDGDGDLDLIVGEQFGTLRYFRNTGAGFAFEIVTIPQNDAPVLANPIADQSVAEDTLWNFTFPANAFSEPDGSGLIYTATLDGGASLPLWLGFTGGTRTFSGTPPQDFNGQLDITVTATDSASTTASDTFTLTITPVNDAPDNDEPGPGGNAAFLPYLENQAPTAINPTLSFTDPDDPTLVAGRVSVVTGFQANQDVLAFVNDGATMGNIAIVSNVGGVLTLGSAGGIATVAQWNAALRAVTYFNSSDTPSTTDRILSYQVDDGGGFVVVDDATIGITALNDAVNDFNRDGRSDILFQHDNGTPAIWLLDGTNVIGQAVVGANPGSAWTAIGSGDFDGDERADILWQHDNGTAAAWLMNGTTVTAQAILGMNPGAVWSVIDAGDFNGDGKDDILWQHDDGSVGAWLMNGTAVVGSAIVGSNPGTAWNAIGTGDFNGDLKTDILWQHDNGTAGIWLMDGTSVLSTAGLGASPGAAWNVIGAGDFNGDLKSDILWQHDNGTVGVWLMDGTTVLSTAAVGTNPGTAWNVIGAFDVNGDGKSDILFQHDDGTPGIWLMDGVTVTSTAGIGTTPGAAWNIIPEHDLVV